MDTLTKMVQRQKKDLVEKVRNLDNLLAESKAETKKAETDAIRNE